MGMNYFVYYLKSDSAKKSYVGITADLNRRLSEHNSGKSSYTKRYMPWKMIYNEFCGSLENARIREKYLKSAVGRKFLKKIFDSIDR